VSVVGALCAAAYFALGHVAALLTPLLPPSVDRALGSAASTQLSLGVRRCEGEAEAYVQRLAAPLLAAAGPGPFEFSFVVVDDASVNAFALPGGYVSVHRGLLEAAESGEEVAGVLAHEIQHALLRHGTRRMLAEMGGFLVIRLLTGGSDLATVGELSGSLASLQHSRDQEAEADRQALELLARARVDPTGLPRFFERLAASGGNPPAMLSTHPDPGERAERARALAPSGDYVALPAPPRPVCPR
jgi:predicted Zn-dependent protease